MLKHIVNSLKSGNNSHRSDSPVIHNADKLQKIIDKKSRLLVKVERSRQVYQSMLLSVDTFNQTLLLDELFPQPDIQLENDQLIYIEFHDQGSITSFSSQFMTTTRRHGLPAILITYPDVIECDQRRNCFRLAIDQQQTVSAKLFQNRYDNFYGIVKDISSHGLRINLSGNQSDQLDQGDVLQSCVIKLDDINQIECQLTVRSKRYFNRPYRHTQIGTEITAIDLKHRNLLTNYVSHQQRQQCRQRAANRL